MRARKIWMVLLVAALWGCDDDTDPTEPPVVLIDGSVDGAFEPDAEPDAIVDMAPDMALDMAAVDMAPDMGDVAGDMALDMAPDAEIGPLACANGEDDDGDGLVDYPLDPGCTDAADDDEADPDAPACADGEDNDGDGRVDHPDDPGCADPADPSEASACGDGELRDITGLARVEGDTTGQPALRSTCRNNIAPEAVFRFTLRTPVERLRFDTIGSSFDTLLGVYRDCGDELEVACNDDVRAGVSQSEVIIEAPDLGDYVIVVDGFADAAGPFVLNIAGELADGAACTAPAEGEPTPAIGCGQGQACRDGICVRAQCADGLDNDEDGRVDYPNEPGCAAPVDDDETDPVPPPQCSDGIDNDFDFDTDYPADQNCASAADDDEDSPPQCSDGIDNDRDGLVDLDDPGCQGDPERFSEFNTAACRNRLDDDMDGLTDYPADPGCLDPNDPLEDDPPEPPACANMIDDDGDGLTDFPEDAASCLAASDPSEDEPCPRTEPRDITRLTRTAGNTAEGPNDFAGSCQPNGSSREQALVWRVAPGRALDSLVLDARNSDIDTVIYARDTCGGPELGCDDNGGNGIDARLALGPQPEGRSIWIWVDGASGAAGVWRVRIEAHLADGADCGPPGDWICGDGLFCTETPDGPRCLRAPCDNGVDDDGDGLVDWPVDPGCMTASDDDETDPPVPPACANGLDDDGDGLIDYPDDPSCPFAADDHEQSDCANGVDDDGDGGIDYDRDGDGIRDPTRDLQCACPADESEASQPQCSDQCDNDGDGLIDLEDPGCVDGADTNEFNQPACQDGLDNDLDGLFDFPQDPGCRYLGDGSEVDPDVLPACANGLDDDDDGWIDFPQDPGCAAAADGDERPRCESDDLVVFDGEGMGGIGFTNEIGLPEEVGSCRFNQAPDVTFEVDVPYPARVVADTAGSGFDTALYARSTCEALLPCPPDDPACVPQSSELACNDNAIGLQSRVAFDAEGGGPVYLIVDGFGVEAGLFDLSVDVIYPDGGQCGPIEYAYARCADGTVCRPDPVDGTPTCGAP